MTILSPTCVVAWLTAEMEDVLHQSEQLLLLCGPVGPYDSLSLDDRIRLAYLEVLYRSFRRLRSDLAAVMFPNSL